MTTPETWRLRYDTNIQMAGEFLVRGDIEVARWYAKHAAICRDHLLTDSERQALTH